MARVQNRKRQLIAAEPNTGREHNCSQAADHRENEQIWALHPSTHHLKIFGQSKDKDHNKKYEQPDRQIRYEAVSSRPNVAITFLN